MKRWARKSKLLIIAFKVFQNWRMRRRFAAGSIETEHGSTHSSKTLAESLNYIDEQFDDYLTYGELTREQLWDKRILELGFGDNVGVALRFLAAGASQVVGIDKFYSKRDVGREREVYAALRQKLSGAEQERFDDAVDLTDGIKFNPNKLSCINGLDLEAAAGELASEGKIFDFIISRAVIEEIYEPERFFLAADRLLAPAGLMLHKIDLSDYGIFADGGMHELTFLTINESLYRLMATDSGIPNRKLIDYYRQQMGGLGYDARFFITSLVGYGPVVPHKENVALENGSFKIVRAAINEIRPKLSQPFGDMTDEDLMVRGTFLAARKPPLRP